MALATISAPTECRYIFSNNAVWSTCRNGFGLEVKGPEDYNPFYPIANLLDAAEQLTATYSIFRAFLFFNLVPYAGYTINSATLKFWVLYKANGSASYPYIQVCKGFQSNPVVVGDWADHTNQNEVLGQKETYDFGTGSYQELLLNGDGLAWVISKLGAVCKFCIKHQHDNENHELGAAHDNGIAFYHLAQGSAYTPQLVLDYTAIVAHSKAVFIA